MNDPGYFLALVGMFGLVFGLPVLILVANDYLRRRGRRGHRGGADRTDWGVIGSILGGVALVMVGGGVVSRYDEAYLEVLRLALSIVVLVGALVWMQRPGDGEESRMRIALRCALSAPVGLAVAAMLVVVLGVDFGLPEWFRWGAGALFALLAAVLLYRR